MLDLLGERDRSVTELAAPFRMTQPAIAQHPRVLRKAELVQDRRAGRRRLYHLEPARLAAVDDWVARYQARDPFGHVWALATAKELVTPEQIGERIREFLGQPA